MWCATYFNLKVPDEEAWIHPEICNILDKMKIRCWLSGPIAKAVAKDAMLAAGLPIEEEHSNHLVYQNLPLETGDEGLISELKTLLRTLLPIVGRQ